MIEKSALQYFSMGQKKLSRNFVVEILWWLSQKGVSIGLSGFKKLGPD